MKIKISVTDELRQDHERLKLLYEKYEPYVVDNSTYSTPNNFTTYYNKLDYLTNNDNFIMMSFLKTVFVKGVTEVSLEDSYEISNWVNFVEVVEQIRDEKV